MPISFLTTALLIVSVITNLTVEGIKKLLDGTKVKYSSNVLAAVLSVLIACAVSVIYLTVITSTASDGRILTKTFSDGFLTMTNVLKSAAGAEVARAVKTFDSDGKLISTVVTYS